MTDIWTDISAAWNSPNWTDMCLNISGNISNVYALTYNSSNNLMYAGGTYASIAKNGKYEPFIVSYNPTTNVYSDISAAWNSPNWTDLCLNYSSGFFGGGIVYGLTYNSSNNLIYAGGRYASIAKNGTFEPFIVSYNPTTNVYSDISAAWNSPNWTDLCLNSSGFFGSGSVHALTYNSSNNLIYAGGIYSSIAKNGKYEPFIVSYNPTTNVYSDISAAWNSPNWTDLCFNSSNVFGGGIVYGLTYNSSNNLIYAGGTYASIAKNGTFEPFIVSYNPTTNVYSDISAAWNSPNWTDLCFNIVNSNYCLSLTYDSSDNLIYAGGRYASTDKNGDQLPFIVNYNPTTNVYSDISAAWHSTNWTDLCLNDAVSTDNDGVNALTYVSSSNKIYAGGAYASTANNGTFEPFIVSNNKTIYNPSQDQTQAICFQKGTKIMTPDGFVLIEQLKKGDLISTKKGNIPIKKMIDFIGTKDKCPLYCLRKDSFGEKKPINDLYMSGDHAFKTNGLWHHMKCSPKTKKVKNADNIHYYHIIIDNYFTHTINAEGIEVETCFKPKKDGIYMLWNCTKECCVPLHCHIASNTEIIKNNKNNNNKTDFSMPFQKQAVIKYDNTLLYIEMNNTKIPLICSEIELPLKPLIKKQKNIISLF